MSSRGVRWGLAAGALFVVFLVFTLPARHVWGWFADAQIAARGIEGTAWRGRVERIVAQGLPLGPVTWQLRPQALLLGRWEYQLFVQSGAGGGELRAGSGVFTGRYLQAVQATLPAAEIAHAARLSLASLAGDVQIDLDELRLDQESIRALQGVVVWRSAQIVQPSALLLGHLQMRLGMRGDQIIGELGDQGGPLALSGEVSFDASRHYRLDAFLEARPDASPALRDALSLLGSPDAQGRYRLQYSGSL